MTRRITSVDLVEERAVVVEVAVEEVAGVVEVDVVVFKIHTVITTTTISNREIEMVGEVEAEEAEEVVEEEDVMTIMMKTANKKKKNVKYTSLQKWTKRNYIFREIRPVLILLSTKIFLSR